MAPPRTVVTSSNCSLLLIYWPRKDERLSWSSWRTYGGQFAYISGHPSAVSRAQDSESLPVKDRRSTTAPQNQLSGQYCSVTPESWPWQMATVCISAGDMLLASHTFYFYFFLTCCWQFALHTSVSYSTSSQVSTEMGDHSQVYRLGI